VDFMARKNSADKIKDLKEQMRKIEQQIREQEKKRDEELGRIFREEWSIEDSETAHYIINSLKSEVDRLIKSYNENSSGSFEHQALDQSSLDKTEVLS
jgi:cell division protein YceG involved in septum cleavage